MFYTMCIIVFSSTTIGQPYFITKMPTFGLFEYKVEGSGCGFNQKRGLAETDSLFIIKLTCSDRAESLHHNMSVIFYFSTGMTRKIDKN